jgi:hypothetical protein
MKARKETNSLGATNANPKRRNNGHRSNKALECMTVEQPREQALVIHDALASLTKHNNSRVRTRRILSNVSETLVCGDKEDGLIANLRPQIGILETAPTLIKDGERLMTSQLKRFEKEIRKIFVEFDAHTRHARHATSVL